MRILILSKGRLNYSTQRLAQVAKDRGHEVDIVNYLKCYLTVETGKETVRYEGEELGDYDAVIPRIAAKYTVYASAILRQMELKGMFLTTRSLPLARSRDKLRSLQILARSGVPIPKTVFANETADIDDILEQVGGAPVIIKTIMGTHGRGVVLGETKKAAKAVMQAFYVEGVEFLVQDFVAEANGEDIRALVVGGKIVAAMERKSLDDDFRSNLHQGGTAKPVVLTASEKRVALSAAKSLGLDLCGVDMIRSDTGVKVLEVNSSPGFGIEKITGTDVATPIIEFIEQTVSAKKPETKPKPSDKITKTV
jgi:ribosomal protein S6--L-glutamate ligase